MADGDGTGDVRSRLAGDTINIDSMFDSSSMMSGGSCPNDITISVMGAQILLPISQMCPFFLILGHILVVVSLFSGARIIIGGF